MKKVEMPVGQKVRGYGLLNEYGEFEFIPEQTGIRKDAIKLVKEGDGFKLYETKNRLLIKMSFDKATDVISLLKNFFHVQNQLIPLLKQYEF